MLDKGSEEFPSGFYEPENTDLIEEAISLKSSIGFQNLQRIP